MDSLVKLLHYSVYEGLIDFQDYDYAFNRLNQLLKRKTSYQAFDPHQTIEEPIEALLKPLLDEACERGLIKADTTMQRDLFEGAIMDVLTPHPSALNERFESLRMQSPKKATDDFYHRSLKSNYIKTARIKKNKFYEVSSSYGDIEITINLSKPEKDPKDIAKATESSSYPKCLLCKENVGYYGHLNHPPRSNHRIIRMPLNREPFYFQFSPYVYYNEHAIVLHKNHIPMEINIKTFKRLFDFIDQFPHYFLGSNAGLPIVGGSILSHEHYQGGHADFPIDRAESFYQIKKDDITYELLHWPLSVVRMKGRDKDHLINQAEAFRTYFESYSDEDLNLVAKTDQQHNAITPILRKEEQGYVLTLALRNNRTDEAYPDGIFHPHPSVQHIKKENIGLIEVMGLAILPGRLDKAFDNIAKVLEGKQKSFDGIKRYQAWIEDLKTQMPTSDTRNLIEQSAGKLFIQGLEDCGIFKQNHAHREKFIAFLNKFLS